MTDEELRKQFKQVTNLIDTSMEINANAYDELKQEIVGVRDELKQEIVGVKEDLNEFRTETNFRLDSLDRRLKAEADWKDEASIRIKKLENKFNQ